MTSQPFHQCLFRAVTINETANEGDNLVLEVALMGGADVLVTGDKKHLLPLKNFQGIIIEPPSVFLTRLDAYQ